MSFWKYNGATARNFPQLGITAKPGYVYDLGAYKPPNEPLPKEGQPYPQPLNNWVSDPGPATDGPVRQAADLSGEYAPQVPTSGSYTYNTDGTVSTDPDGNAYTYNSDGSVHTITKGSVTRTATYNADGTIASWA
jgi:hypothetical protein